MEKNYKVKVTNNRGEETIRSYKTEAGRSEAIRRFLEQGYKIKRIEEIKTEPKEQPKKEVKKEVKGYLVTEGEVLPIHNQQDIKKAIDILYKYL